MHVLSMLQVAGPALHVVIAAVTPRMGPPICVMGVTQKNGKTCPQSNRGFWRCRGGDLVPAFQFVALFFACAREDCALPEYPRGVNWYNDIFEIWARFWPGSPRKITKK